MTYDGATVWELTPQMVGRPYKIIDSSGIDWFDFRSWTSNYAYDLYIDIRPGTYYNPIENYDFGYRINIISTTILENVYSGSGNDRIVGNIADNNLLAGSGNDRIWGLTGNDRIFGQSGHDQIFGGFGNDILVGDEGVDRLYGESGGDTLVGGTYADYLYGGNEGDDLLGYEGQDRLNGGAGADRFVFREVMFAAGGNKAFSIPNGETPLAAPDYIFGFDGPGNGFGDVIDLRQIDANFYGYPNELINEAFAFYGTAPTGGVLAALWLRDEGGNTVVYGNTYEVGSPADFKIVIVDGGYTASQYTAADFYL